MSSEIAAHPAAELEPQSGSGGAIGGGYGGGEDGGTLEAFPDTPFQTMSGREFIRRLKHNVTRKELAYTWLLGAGCSISSGVPSAGECVLRWLKELKYMATGIDTDVDPWAARHFVGYDPDDPAGVYAAVFHSLFTTEQDRRGELEALVNGAEPGFGYATLAQLMTHENWGRKLNVALSVNYDDLLADALHLFSQIRPQLFTHESLNRRTPLSTEAPTVVKLYGDAHLPAAERAGNQPRFNHEVAERLQERICGTGLIIAGYGGRDQAVLDLVEGLPTGQPAGGVFWVSSEPPQGAFSEWMETRESIWVRHGDWDELLYFARLEFGLSHPKIERFERILRKYEAQHRTLSTRRGLDLGPTPESLGAGQTGSGQAGSGQTGSGDAGAFTLNAPGKVNRRRETPESRRERLRKSLEIVSKAVGAPNRQSADAQPTRTISSDAVGELLRNAKGELFGGAPAPRPLNADDGEGLLTTGDVLRTGFGDGRRNAATDAEPLELGPDAIAGDTRAAAPGESLDDVLARLGGEGGLDIEEPPLAAPEADRIDESAVRDARSRALQRMTDGPSRSTEAGGSGDESPAPHLKRVGRALARRGRAAAAAAAAATPSHERFAEDGLPAEPIRRLSGEEAVAGRHAFVRSLESRRDDAQLWGRFARFLAYGAGDYGGAEEAFERADQLAPQDLDLLRDYARFSAFALKDLGRAEDLLGRALNVELQDPKSLLAMSEFLLRARGDVEDAETCLRAALEMAPGDVDALIAFAGFLDKRRSRREAAGQHYRRAAEATPRDPRAIAEFALFQALRTFDLDGAERALTEGSRLAPEHPMVLYAEAEILERKGELDDAEARFRRAVELAPGEPRISLAYARFLTLRRGASSAAERVLAAAGEAAPLSAEPPSAHAAHLDALARAEANAESRGELWARAKGLHQKAESLEPFNPDVLCAHAVHLSDRGEELSEADERFRDALVLAPRASGVLRAYGRFLATHANDPHGAEEHFRKAVEVDPQGVEALEELADFLHMVKRDAEEAELYFREALRQAPDRAETLSRFSVFLRDTKDDFDEAQRYYQKAVERAPRDARTLGEQARFLFSQGDRSHGRTVLNDAFEAAWKMDSSARPKDMMLEFWFMRYAFEVSRLDAAARAVLGLIDAGVRCDGAELEALAERAIAEGHPEPDFLRALAHVAAEGGSAASLDAHRRRLGHEPRGAAGAQRQSRG